MTTLERGAHEADNVYAFDPDEEDDADLETSRLPLLIAIALVVLAAFAGVVWLAYTQGVEEGRADAPRIASAQIRNAPAKTAANPYAGLKIYQPPASSDAGNQPIAPAPSGQDAASDSSQPRLRPSANATDNPASAAQAVQAPDQSAPLPTSVAGKAVVPAKSQPMPPDIAPVAAPSQISTAPNADSASQPAAASVMPQSTGPGVVLQIGSYKSAAEARNSWNTFRSRHAIAAAYGSEVKQVDLGAKGIWYRLRIGSFEDRRAAAAFCDKLKAQGASCIVSR